MKPSAVDAWFESNTRTLESAYLAAEQPWQQSGFGLNTPRTLAAWTAHRKVIADAIDSPGSVLDIGCANGFLLQCLVEWTAEGGIQTDPYGLDLSEKLVKLARARLPEYSANFFTGNAWYWVPPRRFDYVRTELVYVPVELQEDYVHRILDRYLAPGGRLIAAQYRSHGESGSELTIDEDLAQMGFVVEDVRVAHWDGEEKTRIALVRAG